MRKIFLLLIISLLIFGCVENNLPGNGSADDTDNFMNDADNLDNGANENTNNIGDEKIKSDDLQDTPSGDGISEDETQDEDIQKSALIQLNEFDMLDQYKKEFVRDFDILECQSKTYFTDASITEVIDWYYSDLPYTLVSKDVFNPPENPDVEIGYLVFKKENTGIYIDVQPAETIPIATGKTLIIYAECPWAMLKEVVGDVSGELGVEGDIDWSDAYVFEDPEADFWKGSGSPPEIINYPPSDILKIYVKNDDAYLYVKYEVAGQIPALPYKYGEDTIRIFTYFTLIDKDQNPSTGIKNGYTGADLALDFWFGSPPEANGKMYSLIQYAFYDPAGEEELGSFNDGGTLIAGGLGYTYVASKYKLADLGLKKGDTINIFPLIEVESDSYHHFARDVYKKDVEWTSINIK
ncbi:MAG: hypothetical protein V1672_04325 [Candidatus Diapherotrites archaeon]